MTERDAYSRRQRIVAIVAIVALLVTLGGGLAIYLLIG